MAASADASGQTFLGASGPMAARMAAYDWSTCALGPVERWPLSLQTAVRIALRSRFAMWLCWGPDLTFFCNDAYLPTLGVKQSWALGASARRVWEEIWPDIGPRIQLVLDRGIATWDEGLLLYLERSGVREETYHTFSYSPLTDDIGAVQGMLCVVAEETSRVINERRVEVLSSLAAALTTVASEAEALEVVGRQLGRRRRVAPFASIYLQTPAGSLARRASTAYTPEQLASAPCKPECMALLERAVGLREAVLIDRLPERVGGPLPSVDGESVRAALALPIASARGSVAVGVLVVGLSPAQPLNEAYRDFLSLLVSQVSAGLAAGRAFDDERRRAAELLELDRAKTAFFSNVSHEFRTPLTLMLGPLEAALDSDEACAGEDLRMVHRNGLRLLKLVNALLDFSKIEAGRFDTHPQATDLAQFTAELASSFRSAAERAGLELTIDCEALPPLLIDRYIWERVVLNLLSNALKYTLRGRIRVSLRAAGADAILDIADTGIGIAADELPRVFERFKRIAGAQGRSHEGTGIGLALVREMVGLLRGRVTASSVPGVGSIFSVTIPALAAAGVEPIAHPRSADAEAFAAAVEVPTAAVSVPVNAGLRQPAARPRVLVADDNADMRAYLERLLADRWQVVAVADGVAALEALGRQRPDLVLADVMMPRMDGFELLARLRAEAATADIPVLLLSARAGEEARIEGLDAGADDYLTKPFSGRELIARVNGVISLAAARREARRVEQKLRADRDHVLESMFDGFIELDAGWRIGYANRAAERLLGTAREQLKGEMLWERYPALLGGYYEDSLRRSMRERVPVMFQNFYEPWQRWFEVSAYPTDGGRLSLYFRDISEQKALLDNLQEADRRKDEFLATLAHELRNPLAPIQNAAEILSLPAVAGPEVTWVSSVLNRQVQHMSRLLEDLLDVSRISMRKMEMKIEQVTLSGVLEAAIETARPLIAAREHTLEVVQPDSAVTIAVDPVRMAQVLTNLLNNAAKYTDPRGRIVLSAAVDGSELRLAIADNGIGLSPGQAERVFQLFSQVQSSLTRAGGGLGIGLALVRGIVELHGGRIEAHSDGLGRGSRFLLHLPVVCAGEADDPRTGGIAAPASGGALRVLVADDNRDAAESLEILLELEGHAVTGAGSGQAALAALVGGGIDIAFIDIGMPDLNGYEVARRLRAAGDGAEFATMLVALTGWGQAEDKARAREAGFDAHVVKPITIERLHQLLAEARERRTTPALATP